MDLRLQDMYEWSVRFEREIQDCQRVNKDREMTAVCSGQWNNYTREKRKCF